MSHVLDFYELCLSLVLSEWRMRSTVNLPEAFHLKPKPFGHFTTIVYTKALTCNSFGNAPFQYRKNSGFMAMAVRKKCPVIDT